ncbi:hypothetical protein SLS53_003329 [Cytospora paraplurivora]|uniref:N-acetyltransferase domain-containing protein n=1 Tax=Cytospora paraplurivora TaxID=2898453 RepID=A0AAN9UDM2_9PEZI
MASISLPPNPQFRTRKATPADASAIVNIHFGAFGPGVWNRLIYPDGGSESARANFAWSLFESPENTADPSVEIVIVVAELVPQQKGQDPEVVAFAKWKLIKEPLPKERWDVAEHQLTNEELGEGSNAAVFNHFVGGLHELRKKWMKGDPALHLEFLASHPEHQRTGAGSALLKWGAELADKEGKSAWLESTPVGYNLYKRFGFEDVDVQDLPVTELWGLVQQQGEDWGADTAVALAGELPKGHFRTVVMRRLPQKA